MEFNRYDELAKREQELPAWIVAQYKLNPASAEDYLCLDYWTPDEAAALVLGFHPAAITQYHDPLYLHKLSDDAGAIRPQMSADEFKAWVELNNVKKIAASRGVRLNFRRHKLSDEAEAIRAQMSPLEFEAWIEINNVIKMAGYRGVRMNFQRHWDYRGQRHISPLEWVQRANALKIRLPKPVEDWFRATESGVRSNRAEHQSRRAETTYLNIIGGLVGLMLGKSPAGKALSIYESQAAIIEALEAHHEGKPGMSARTLQEKFAAAKRSLNGT